MNANQVSFTHQTTGNEMMLGFAQPTEMMEAFTRGLKMVQGEYKGATVQGNVRNMGGGEMGLPVYVKKNHIGWLAVK